MFTDENGEIQQIEESRHRNYINFMNQRREEEAARQKAKTSAAAADNRLKSLVFKPKNNARVMNDMPPPAIKIEYHENNQFEGDYEDTSN